MTVQAKQVDDGGPAFPRPTVGDNDGSAGMTLRDWFAGQANPRDVYGDEGLPTSIAEALMGEARPSHGTSPVEAAVSSEWWSSALAMWKYQHADEMLAARRAGGGA